MGQVPGAHAAAPRILLKFHQADSLPADPLPHMKNGRVSLKKARIHSEEDLAWVTPKISEFFSHFNGEVTMVRIVWGGEKS